LNVRYKQTDADLLVVWQTPAKECKR